MPDGHMSVQRLDHRFRAEVVGDMAETAMGMEMFPITGHYAGRFLTSVLQGVQAEGRVRGGVGMAENAEYAAFFMQAIVV
jgi:hypothetical protein